ncbi:Homocysteine S-methyltransferase [Atractiella rhizophila]|nr:Homocysteine S-methyltransferase [Atractiella rhizophila]
MMDSKPCTPIVFLDGGLGTTLQDLHDVDLSTAAPTSTAHLWSSALLLSGEGTKKLRQAHASFVQAGSDVIETATYPLSIPSLHCLQSSEEAKDTLRLGVTVTLDAIESGELEKAPKLALSLGSLGALLVPGAEYSGIYPQPYGPSLPQGNPHGFPSGTEKAFKDAALRAMASFHYSRLSDFYISSTNIWDRVSYIAFETVPTAVEAQSICRAVYAFYERFPQAAKMWWISFVFPPDSINKLDESLINLTKFLFTSKYPPWGIGLNCTHLSRVPALLSRLGEAMANLTLSKEERPFLVLYPDGGAVYDVVQKKWDSDPDEPKVWAKKMEEIVNIEVVKEYWGGIAVGGCCKTGPSHIKELKRLFS